jgi:hypothetical protein
MIIGITRIRGSKEIPHQPVKPSPQITVPIPAIAGIATPCQRRK